MTRFILSAFVLAALASPAKAVTIEFMHTPSIGSMQYRATGDIDWLPAKVNGLHGQFETTATSVDVSIDGLFATHDLAGMTSGAFVTVVGKSPSAWWFNYDTYHFDEVNRWLPVSSSAAGVPEPASAMLAILAALGTALAWRSSK